MKRTLKTFAEYSNVYRNGVTRNTRLGVVRVHFDVTDKAYGVITPKKLGNAVERNRIKRRVRPILLAELDHADRNLHVTFQPNSKAHTATADELEQALASVIRKT